MPPPMCEHVGARSQSHVFLCCFLPKFEDKASPQAGGSLVCVDWLQVKLLSSPSQFLSPSSGTHAHVATPVVVVVVVFMWVLEI